MARADSVTKKPSVPLHFSVGDPELDRLLRPSAAFQTPSDVIEDGSLSIAEKRAILSSWASDSCAVDSIPALRRIPASEHLVHFDDIMDALRSLDHVPVHRRRQDGRTKDAQPKPDQSVS